MNTIKNEYFEECKIFIDKFDFRERRKFTSKYSWAIPNEEALKELDKYSPLVEIGAGSGYWAYLAKSRGVKITPYDAFLGEKNKYKHFESWVTIHKGDESTLLKFDKNTNLFLCWPPYDSDMALNCAKNFKGSFIIYVGEDFGGCNANDEFFYYIENNFEKIGRINIPKWFGIHDYMTIYKRRKL